MFRWKERSVRRKPFLKPGVVPTYVPDINVHFHSNCCEAAKIVISFGATKSWQIDSFSPFFHRHQLQARHSVGTVSTAENKIKFPTPTECLIWWRKLRKWEKFKGNKECGVMERSEEGFSKADDKEGEVVFQLIVWPEGTGHTITPVRRVFFSAEGAGMVGQAQRENRNVGQNMRNRRGVHRRSEVRSSTQV
jgi:hypothetical protein